MGTIRLNILVREEWRDRYPQVLEQCRQAGLVVEYELVTIGVIAGTIEAGLLPALTDLEGVSAVEPERQNFGLKTYPPAVNDDKNVKN